MALTTDPEDGEPEQDGQHRGIKYRIAGEHFDLPREVNDRADRGEVHEAVEESPLLPETADPSLRGGQGQRHQEQERREAQRDKGALQDVADHRAEREAEIKSPVRRDVEGCVEELEQPAHPAALYNAVPAGEAPVS